ncbi:hypothetical protein Ahy_A10g049962 isoform D [Arachis hypogaea]|uniref:Uncharacterized protein n=2 Tax=Arachis hypogaea TaxID=3818 RepID=A0A445B8A9_ARAHY|nr:hypothetical protein Ahy_A10g049962 isoform D [Arachis hypogaea]
MSLVQVLLVQPANYSREDASPTASSRRIFAPMSARNSRKFTRCSEQAM